jgi:hypothetical protein
MSDISDILSALPKEAISSLPPDLQNKVAMLSINDDVLVDPSHSAETAGVVLIRLASLLGRIELPSQSYVHEDTPPEVIRQLDAISTYDDKDLIRLMKKLVSTCEAFKLRKVNKEDSSDSVS